MDGREAAITVAPGRAAPGCGSVLAAGGGARGSGESMGATAHSNNHFFSRRTVDRLGQLNMQPPVLHSGATLADERRQMPSRPAGERPSGENARHNGRVAVWRKLALESRERAALCSERFPPMSV